MYTRGMVKLVESVAWMDPADERRKDERLDAVRRAVLERCRWPRATYRLQFTPSFTFADARKIVPYLDQLGVSDVYASPLLKATRGSTHGYDIVDHHVLNPALGSAEDFDLLAAALRERGMGLVFDVVPNHMGIADPDNSWWMDVLEDGPSSPYAAFFDIDWHPLRAEAGLENRVLLPVLGDAYGKVLEAGELVLTFEEGAFSITYFDRRMPISPRNYAELLGARLEEVAAALGADHPNVLELQSIITAANYLPRETETDPEKIAERQREKGVIKRRIAQLAASSPEVRAAIARTVVDYNGKPGDRRSFDALDNLLNQQSYRLAFWRVAGEEINFRRFFDINDLAAIRMERSDVFDEAHHLILQLVADGKVTGLRIDHADGLWDPSAYLDQLQDAALGALAREPLDAAYGASTAEREAAATELLGWRARERAHDPSGPLSRPFYVVIEKILGRGETLPAHWTAAGTTGYEFANLVNGLFVDQRNEKAMSDLYAAFTRTVPPPFPDLVNSTKKMIMLISLAGEMNELASELKRIARQHRWYRDLTLNSLAHATREVMASLPIYRTYLTEGGGIVEPHDRAAIEAAVADAKRRNPRTAREVFDFVRLVLLQRYPEDGTEEARAEWDRFVLRFQQTSSPVTAKGVEDTAFYVYNRLLSLNEVGGQPEQFGVPPEEFHRQNAARLANWPGGLLAGSTHDSKRSADVRARLDVLSELPRTFRRSLMLWARRNRGKKLLVHGQPVPDRNEEYLIYQSLLGAWPPEPLDAAGRAAFRQRMTDYVQKALKEAKLHSSWINPNAEYDAAVARFVDALLVDRDDDGFLKSFRPLQEMVAFFGMLNGLAQTLLQLTAPGVPDLYQGNELWDFSLVDPDNRRPVDFATREALLRELQTSIAATSAGTRRARASSADAPAAAAESRVANRAPAPDLAALARERLATWSDGRIKLFVIYQALKARRARPEVFATGDYAPLEPIGPAAEHVVGFTRSSGQSTFLTIVPRLCASLTGEQPILPLGAEIWADTAVVVPSDKPGDLWRNCLTGETVTTVDREGRTALPLAEVFNILPVALFERG